MTVALPCLKFFNVYSWFSGKNSQTFSRYTKFFRGLFILQYYIACFRQRSTQAVTKYHFLSSVYSFMDVRNQNVQLAPLRMKPFTTCASIIALLTPTTLSEIHSRVISSRKYSLSQYSRLLPTNFPLHMFPPTAP